MDMNKYIEKNRVGRHHTKLGVCKDGLEISIQASATHYCSPADDVGPYTTVEIGNPSESISEFEEYRDPQGADIFGHVPIELVEMVIDKHGGISSIPYYDTDMTKYEDFAPTGFDPKGYLLDDRQDWYVLPVSITRDSGVMAESNFTSAMAILGGERANITEIHRFGHWGPGWFEIIIVNPKAGKTMRKAMGIECSLADYPILDESDWSAREWEAMNDIWARMGLAERMEVCCDTDNSKFAARHDSIPENVYAEHLGVD